MEVHDRFPKSDELSLAVRQYDAITKLKKVVERWSRHYEAMFGNRAEVEIAGLERARKKLRSVIEKLVEEDFEELPSIEGLSKFLLGKLLAYAHPRRFPTLRKFLRYCGYRGTAKYDGKYCRRAKSTAYLMVWSVIIHKDREFYPRYLKMREEFSRDNPDWSKGKVDGVVRNRLATLLLKKIYRNIWSHAG